VNTPFFLFLCLLCVGLPAMLLALPFYGMWTHHKRQMEELRLKNQGSVNHQMRAEMDAMRAEIQQLRDTTMQYDLSFDAALQRVEQRVGSLEIQQRRQTEEREQTLYGIR
jgi:hypothetical protein